ncbi:MAG: cytochrome c [Pseudomonadota bacterium]
MRLLAAFCLSASSYALAGDPMAGNARAATCMACHGPAGISSQPLWPNLAGQKEAYLKKQLMDFRDGRRNDPSMSAMARALSDEDIANLAAYYAGLPRSRALAR